MTGNLIYKVLGLIIILQTIIPFPFGFNASIWILEQLLISLNVLKKIFNLRLLKTWNLNLLKKILNLMISTSLLEKLWVILFFLWTVFRNICAHNERLYNHRFTANNINSFIIHEHYSLNFNYGLFDLILILKFFITQLEYRALKSLLTYSLAFLSLNVDESDFIKILNKMKFPKNWGRNIRNKRRFAKGKRILSKQCFVK